MPVHDWMRVDAGIFHDFHTVWMGQIRTALNEGLLPNGFYALTEQHVGRSIADVLTLHASPASSELLPLPPVEATYQAAYRGMPAFWREVLEGSP